MESKHLIKKILLVSPRYTLFKNDVRRSIPPIGLLYLAAFLEKHNYEVGILDIANEGYDNILESGDFITYGLTDGEIIKRINKFKPDIVGVSCIFSTQSKNANHIIEMVKQINPKIITIMGGSHPTFTAKKSLKNKDLDFVIMGEGELPTLQLLESLQNRKNLSEIKGLAFKQDNKIIINTPFQYLENLDELPFPAYHLINMEKYFKINLPQNPYPQGNRVIQIVTSRGCSARCVFCTTTNFWGNRYRGRSAEEVIREIKKVKDLYGVDEIQFTDDNLTLNKNRAIKILEALKKLNLKWCLPQGVAVWALDNELLDKMKESGCYQLTFAIESGNQHVLSNLIRKPLLLNRVKPLVAHAHSLGIKIHAFCICGIPGETKKQMQETFDFVRDCEIDTASFFVATPLIGSTLLEICQKNHYLSEKFHENETFYKLGNINTPDFSSTEVQELTAFFNKEYNKKDGRKKRFEKGRY